MKTIEERAKEFAPDPRDPDYILYSEAGYVVNRFRDAYIAGATEQKAIDETKLLKLKSAWEKEAQITHDDEANRNQGYHDAIEKACEWLKNNWREYVNQDRDGMILFGNWESDFRKAMEE